MFLKDYADRCLNLLHDVYNLNILNIFEVYTSYIFTAKTNVLKELKLEYNVLGWFLFFLGFMVICQFGNSHPLTFLTR